MDYEKKYKEANGKVAARFGINIAKEIFTDLYESENEKIRKELIKETKGSEERLFETVTNDEFVTWLEKQGEKLPVGFYYVNSEGKKFYSDTFKYGNLTLHVEKQNEKKPFDYENQETQNGHKFNIGDIISNGKVEFRVDNIVKNCIGQDCYFLVNIESEKNGTRYLQLTNSEGKTRNYGEATWLCKQVDSKFEKQGEQKSADKEEPKFHEGDWVIVSTTKGDRAVQIASVEYSKDGYPSYFTTEGRWFGNGTKARLLTDKDVETIIIPESKVIAKTKFHEGDWVVSKLGNVWYIDSFDNKNYKVTDINGNHNCFPIYIQDRLHLWTIQDAKDGDVLINWNNTTFIFKAIENETVKFHVAYNEKWDAIKTPSTKLSHLGLPEHQFEFHPATKEQRDTLMKAMTDAGYTFDFEKKELKKLKFKVGDEVITKNEESLTITRIDEEGYWSEDLFICGFDDSDKWELVEPTGWSEEDENMLKMVIKSCEQCGNEYAYYWLKSLKDRVQPKQEWKQENTDDLTDFENAMMHIGGSFFGQHAGLDPNDTNAIKEQANLLLKLVQTKEWSEEEQREKEATEERERDLIQLERIRKKYGL